jgi:RHS repeat-associated protein
MAKHPYDPSRFIYDCTPRYVHPCVLNVSRFTGKERDTESGLDYFGARYYGSTMGRFMSPDWSAKAQAGWPTQASFGLSGASIQPKLALCLAG